MRKLTPFLKLYTEYVKNFQTATTLVESSEDKSSSFGKLLKEIRVGTLIWRVNKGLRISPRSKKL